MIEPSTKQEARFIAFYLQHCIDDSKTTFDYSNQWLREKADLVLDTPLVERPETFDEHVNLRHFYKYCETVEIYLLFINMIVIEDQFVEADFPYPVPPVEVGYIRVTRFGRLYARLPLRLQIVMLFMIGKAISFSMAWRRFKWLGSATALILGLTSWNKTRQLSGLLVIGSTIGGLLIAWLVSAVAGYFGGEHDDPFGQDP